MISPSFFDRDVFYASYVKNPPALTMEWDLHAKEHALENMKIFAFSGKKEIAIQYAKYHSNENPSDWVFVVTPHNEEGDRWNFIFGTFPNAIVKKVEGENVFSIDRFLSESKKDKFNYSTRFICQGEDIIVTKVAKKFKYSILQMVDGLPKDHDETNVLDAAFRIADKFWKTIPRKPSGKSISRNYVKIVDTKDGQTIFYRQTNNDDSPYPSQSQMDFKDRKDTAVVKE